MLKDDAVKVLHSVYQQIWKTQQWPQDWKRLVFIPIPKKGNAKECSNYRTIALISHASKEMLKILKAKLQQYVNHELPDVQAGLEKAEEPEIKLPTSFGTVNKANTKGVKDSLVLVDDIAFVVNVKDKAVVTVMNKDEMKENVFSNIDGAVIA